jgi:hypothetical protein
MYKNSWHKQIRRIFTFYRNHFLIGIVISLLCLWVLISNGLIAFQGCFWLKLVSYGIVYYFINQLRKNEYHYYNNLGLKKSVLWVTTLSIDFSTYILMIIASYRFGWIPHTIH